MITQIQAFKHKQIKVLHPETREFFLKKVLKEHPDLTPASKELPGFIIYYSEVFSNARTMSDSKVEEYLNGQVIGHSANPHQNAPIAVSYVHHSKLPREVSTYKIVNRLHGSTRFFTRFVKKQRCTQITIQNFNQGYDYAEYIELQAKNVTPEDVLRIFKDKNKSLKSPWVLYSIDNNGIKINVEDLNKTKEGKIWVTGATMSGCLRNGRFYQRLYVREGMESGRKFELGNFSYQCLKTILKAKAECEGQVNLDIKSCHVNIFLNHNPKAKHIIDNIIKHCPLHNKIAVLAIINGCRIKKAIEIINNSRKLPLNTPLSPELLNGLRALREKVLETTEDLGLNKKSLWKLLQKQEQAEVKIVTDYLDACEIGYCNMHDGLMIDYSIDISHLPLKYTWVNKPLS